MSADVKNYQCPACTGPLRFSGDAGKLVCDYCGSDFDVATIETLYTDTTEAAVPGTTAAEWSADEAGSQWSASETEGLRAYSCPSCGAEIICDETTAATSCVYCGNPTVVPGQLGGNLRPDYVIPFALEKETAKQRLLEYYKKKKFLPDSFTEGNHIEEIKGVYAPFWLFDGDADANVRYKATRVHRRRSGNYEITTTEHFRVTRQGNVAFQKVPVDGSSKMPDEHMDAVEPFDYHGIKPFSTAYLPGFFADKYDQDAAACVSRADERIRNSAAQALASTVTGYNSVVPEHTDIRLNHGSVKYALLPVWLLHTKWNGQDFLFAMNGQTGKLIGDLPVDKKKYWMWFFGIFLPTALVLTLIVFLLRR